MEEIVISSAEVLESLQNIEALLGHLLSLNLFYIGVAAAMIVIFLLYKCLQIFI